MNTEPLTLPSLLSGSARTGLVGALLAVAGGRIWQKSGNTQARLLPTAPGRTARPPAANHI